MYTSRVHLPPPLVSSVCLFTVSSQYLPRDLYDQVSRTALFVLGGPLTHSQSFVLHTVTQKTVPMFCYFGKTDV